MAGTAQALRQSFDEFLNLIAHLPVDRQLLLALGQVPGQLGRIIESNVNYFGLAGKNRAMLVRMSANSDDVIELNRAKLRDCLGVLAGDVYARFRHDLDGMRIHSVLREAGGIRLDNLRFQMPRPAFRHLAATGVAGAEKQHFYLWRLHIVVGLTFSIFFNSLRSASASGDLASDFRTQPIASRTATGASLPGNR